MCILIFVWVTSKYFSILPLFFLSFSFLEKNIYIYIFTWQKKKNATVKNLSVRRACPMSISVAVKIPRIWHTSSDTYTRIYHTLPYRWKKNNDDNGENFRLKWMCVYMWGHRPSTKWYTIRIETYLYISIFLYVIYMLKYI